MRLTGQAAIEAKREDANAILMAEYKGQVYGNINEKNARTVIDRGGKVWVDVSVPPGTRIEAYRLPKSRDQILIERHQRELAKRRSPRKSNPVKAIYPHLPVLASHKGVTIIGHRVRDPQAAADYARRYRQVVVHGPHPWYWVVSRMDARILEKWGYDLAYAPNPSQQNPAKRKRRKSRFETVRKPGRRKARNSRIYATRSGRRWTIRTAPKGGLVVARGLSQTEVRAWCRKRGYKMKTA